MEKYRVIYMDSWKGKKSIVIEAGSYWDAREQAKKLFGEKNIISIDMLDKLEV